MRRDSSLVLVSRVGAFIRNFWVGCTVLRRAGKYAEARRDEGRERDLGWQDGVATRR